jgi:RHS repeat-associated protein
MLRGDTTLLTGGISHPFRFTGKELDRQNSLNMYDFGARWYDVAGVPMWTSVDPLAEKNYPFSPYSYCAGDPVNKIDPDGRDDYYTSNGQFLFRDVTQGVPLCQS